MALLDWVNGGQRKDVCSFFPENMAGAVKINMLSCKSKGIKILSEWERILVYPWYLIIILSRVRLAYSTPDHRSVVSPTKRIIEYQYDQVHMYYHNE